MGRLETRHIALIVGGVVTSIALLQGTPLEQLKEVFVFLGMVFSVDFAIKRIKDAKGITT